MLTLSLMIFLPELLITQSILINLELEIIDQSKKNAERTHKEHILETTKDPSSCLPRKSPNTSLSEENCTQSSLQNAEDSSQENVSVFAEPDHHTHYSLTSGATCR